MNGANTDCGNAREDRPSFGEYIRKKRLAVGFTQKELAARLHVTESAVSKWERELSYPDISMVTDICRELNISEHEFFTACDDDQARTQQRQAAVWRGVSRGLFWFFAAGYAVALVTCFVCNLAIFHTLDWFWIVLTTLMLSFSLTTLPFLVKRRRLSLCLGCATISLFLLLLACWLYTGDWWVLGGTAITAVCLALPWSWWGIWWFYGKHLPPLFMTVFSLWVFVLLAVIHIFTGGDWLVSFACPIAAFFVGYAWVLFTVVCWLPVGVWLKAGLCSLLSALAIPFGNTLIAALLPHRHTPTLASYFRWSCLITHENIDGASWVNVLTFVILLGVSIALLAAGIVTEVRRRRA